MDVLITCHPLALARLPWESWELGAEVGLDSHIRIARTPFSIQESPQIAPHKRRRPRILVILGDDRGLDFQREKEATTALQTIADVLFIGWEPGKTIHQVKAQIQTALIDTKGWDALFFAGHSNEKESMGGELGITPNGFVQIAEMKAALAIAKQQGLQFALFNSCKGLNLAESLIDLGLSQVVIMREPVHNSVAEAFFVSFAQSLAQHKDVQECLRDACHTLKTQKALTYPAADLVPSLFRYPHTDLFRLPKTGWRNRLEALLPSRYEAMSLGFLIMMSLRLFVSEVVPGAPQRSALPVQEWLLEQRVLIQALYRQATGRAFTPTTPDLVLIQIDPESLDQANITDPYPIDYGYVNQLVQQLVDLNATTIGMDYLLDQDNPDRFALGRTIATAQEQGVHIVFAQSRDDRGNLLQAPVEIAGTNGHHAAATRAMGDDYHIPLFTPGWTEHLLFAHWLAWLSPQCRTQAVSLCQSDATDTIDPASEPTLVQYFSQQMPRLVRSPFTALGHQLGWQKWLHPITDFSIPPQAVFTAVPAWRLLEEPNDPALADLSQQLVIIAAGGYDEAGISDQSDNFPPPAAIRHWYLETNRAYHRRKMTGGEHQAYLVHHTLENRWVVPIPHLWMVLAIALAGKLVILSLDSIPPSPYRRRNSFIYLTIGSLVYVLFSLELYLSPMAIALPILLPLATCWLYLTPTLLRKSPS